MSDTKAQAPMNPAQFPILRASKADTRRFDDAIDAIAEGQARGSIRNVAFQEVKYILGHAVEEAWKKQVCEPFIYGQVKTLPKEVEDLYWSISLMSLHDVISTSKKVAKCKVDHPALDAMRAYCKEVLPLAAAVAELKQVVVKGRIVGAAPAKPVNPDKLVKTCPVCFRQIAVVGGTMAHHGYQRPGYGLQTASCAGIRFKPLEVSSEGLAWYIESLRTRLASQKRAYAERHSKPETLRARRVRNGPIEQISRDDPLWPETFKRHVDEIQMEIGAITQALPDLEQRLADWKPEPQSD